MIEISHVNKWYGPTFQVLKDCTTSVAKGEVVVVCGPSGSGKSTLIKCVNALEPFQEGQIILDGIKVNDPKTDLPKLRARVGMVFQHFELFPHLRIIENLCLAQEKVLGRSHGEAMAKGEKLLERVGLTVHANKYPAELSGGQQQRVAIARALAMDPIAMLFDEPTSALDPGNDQRGARRHGRPCPRGHDHDGRHPRNGLCQQGRQSRDLHGHRARSSRMR